MYEVNQGSRRQVGLNGSGMGFVLQIAPMHAVPFNPEDAEAGEEAEQADVGTRNRNWAEYWAGHEARQQRRQAASEARPAYEAAAEQQAIEQRQARRATKMALGVSAGGLVIASVLGYFGYRWWKGRDKEKG